ncbi:TetR/AcrR family transcriptional regulator [Conyzicola sp.]|uniref:TetR/AcrR family transcriptional regulator n=1 Tax=Conyzicola sp. TaxID=1969404 RepID=UPI00398A41EA
MIEAAAATADEVGLGHLTLAAVAQRLGVRQPSLYKYVDGVADLRHSVGVRAAHELNGVLVRATAGRAGSDAIRSLSRSYREWAHLHPATYQASQTAATAFDVISTVLGSYDLGAEETIDAARATRSTLHGFLSLENQRAFGRGVDIDRSFERLVHGLIVALDDRP